MNIHDAVEVAYKNGYKAGVKDFAEQFKLMYGIDEHDIIVAIEASSIDELLIELTKRKENEECT